MLRRGETIDEHRERMMAKAEAQRRFEKPEVTPAKVEAAQQIQRKVEARTPPKPQPRARRRQPTPRRRVIGENCVKCGHALRRRGENKPGTKLHIGHGLCSKCFSEKTRRDAGRPTMAELRGPRHKTCAECGVRLRPRRAEPTVGTKPVGGDGKCHTCYERGRRKRAA